MDVTTLSLSRDHDGSAVISLDAKVWYADHISTNLSLRYQKELSQTEFSQTYSQSSYFSVPNTFDSHLSHITR